MKSFIQFGEVFETVQLFECKNLLILKFRKFSTFTGGGVPLKVFDRIMDWRIRNGVVIV